MNENRKNTSHAIVHETPIGEDIEENESENVEKNVNDGDLKSESISSVSIKDGDDNPSTAPNVSDTSSKDMENIIDDDDDVIDEILKYKTTASLDK